MKKALSIILSIIIVMSFFCAVPISATAKGVDLAEVGTQTRSSNFSSNYSITGNWANDIVAVAYAQKGRTQNSMGYTEAWCANFVCDCGKLAKIKDFPYYGACSGLLSRLKKWGGSSNWHSYDSGYVPNKGDVIFFSKTASRDLDKLSHVGLVYSSGFNTDGSVNTIEGNTGNPNGSESSGVYVKKRTISKSNISYIYIVGYYSLSALSPDPDPFSDIGDNFYATITNKNNGKPIENQNDNVVLGSNEPSERHVWKFYRNDDGSYNIVNMYNWKALDLESYGNTNGTNIKCYENTNVSAQRWYLIKKEGGYALVPKCSQNGAMDLDDNNSETGTNIQFWTYNGTSAQIYNINKIDDIRNYLSSDLGDDFYGVIFNKNHNKPIENRNGNVVLGTENHSERQVWHFIRNDDNTYNIVSLFDSKALDVSSYGNANGTNIKVYENSNNNAQRWYLNEAWGGYTISPKCSPNGVMDLDDNNSDDGTNIQFWEYNGTSAQIYNIEKLEDMHGYLSSDIGTDFYGYIKYSAADLRLTNFEGNVTANTPEDMPNQIWKFERQSDNSYLIRSCLDDTCIDSENGEFEDGNNVQTYPDNGTRAQRWYFIKHGAENRYTIKSQLANSLIDVEDSSFESGTNVHLWHPNDTNAQIFEIEICDEETVHSIIDSLSSIDDYFYGVISHPSSGYQITNNNRSVDMENSAVKASKLWRFERQADYSYKITSFVDGSCLDVEGGKCSSGTNVQTYEDNATQAQRWYLVKNGDDKFVIKSGLGNVALDVFSDEQTPSGKDLMLFERDGTNTQDFSINVIENIDEYLATDIGTAFYANISNCDSEFIITNYNENVVLSSEKSSTSKTDQIWRFEKQTDNSYLIRCLSNEKCLDAESGRDDDGNNVQINEDNSTDAQRWIVCELGDNQFLIKSVLGETVLDAYTTGGVVYDGANLQVYHPNGTPAQIYEINKLSLSSISIKQQPDKTTYFVGQDLDTTGLLLELNYGNNITDVVSSGFTTSGFDSSKAGTSTVTVSYQGKTTTFNVQIEEQQVVCVLGDADGDDVVTIFDVTYVQRSEIGITLPTPIVEEAADVDNDGYVCVIDATLIQRYLVGIPTHFNIGDYI